MASKTYSSALAFRTALEVRLNRQAKEQERPMTRLSTFVAFDRLLVRQSLLPQDNRRYGFSLV